ncbi:MAG: Lrp/AsnC family transcriptional regulator [Thermoleophilia bacterium]|nr:Lrp/AsnC family transcriptional regulator [Thermoleophilia bacterium]
MAFDLDAIDRHVLVLLKEDGRMPSSEIARRMSGISERAVRYRIDRLKKSGVLRIAAVLDPLALGYTSIGDVMIDVAPGRLQEVAAELVQIDQVSYVAGAVGDGNLNATVYARDNEELARVIEEIIGRIPGVTRVRSIVVPWRLKEECDWRVPADSAEEGAPMT